MKVQSVGVTQQVHSASLETMFRYRFGLETFFRMMVGVGRKLEERWGRVLVDTVVGGFDR